MRLIVNEGGIPNFAILVNDGPFRLFLYLCPWKGKRWSLKWMKRNWLIDKLARELYDASEAYWSKYGPEFCLPWNETTRYLYREQARKLYS
jgi:hypothetical protein